MIGKWNPFKKIMKLFLDSSNIFTNFYKKLKKSWGHLIQSNDIMSQGQILLGNFEAFSCTWSQISYIHWIELN